MTQDTLSVRIDTVAKGNIGVLMALLDARTKLGDRIVTQFLDKVSEQGEALWVRFRTFQKERGNWMVFGHFIASVVMPDGPKF